MKPRTVLLAGLVVLILFFWSYVPYLLRDAVTLSGEVSDQDGNPLGSAVVVFEERDRRSIIPWPGVPTVRINNVKRTTTDHSGRFTISFRSRNFYFKEITKTGYTFESVVKPGYWSRDRRYISGERRIPEANLIAYKVDPGLEKQIEKFETPKFELTSNSGEYYLDLNAGRISSEYSRNTDLIFAHSAYEHEPYQKFTIQAVDGGVWGSANLFPYAPAEGYEKGVMFIKKGLVGITLNIYVRSKNGKNHSLLLITIFSPVHDKLKPVSLIQDEQKRYIQVYGLVNPTSGRYLYTDWVKGNLGSEHGDGYWQIDYPKGPDRDSTIHYSLNQTSYDNRYPWWVGTSDHVMLDPDYVRRVADDISNDERIMKIPQLRPERYALSFFSRNMYTPADVLIDLSENSKLDAIENVMLPKEHLRKLLAEIDDRRRSIAGSKSDIERDKLLKLASDKRRERRIIQNLEIPEALRKFLSAEPAH